MFFCWVTLNRVASYHTWLTATMQTAGQAKTKKTGFMVVHHIKASSHPLRKLPKVQEKVIWYIHFTKSQIKIPKVVPNFQVSWGLEATMDRLDIPTSWLMVVTSWEVGFFQRYSSLEVGGLGGISGFPYWLPENIQWNPWFWWIKFSGLLLQLGNKRTYGRLLSQRRYRVTGIFSPQKLELFFVVRMAS